MKFIITLGNSQENFFECGHTDTIRSDIQAFQSLIEYVEEIFEFVRKSCWNLISDLARDFGEFFNFRSELHLKVRTDLSIILLLLLNHSEVVSNTKSVL